MSTSWGSRLQGRCGYHHSPLPLPDGRGGRALMEWVTGGPHSQPAALGKHLLCARHSDWVAVGLRTRPGPVGRAPSAGCSPTRQREEGVHGPEAKGRSRREPKIKSQQQARRARHAPRSSSGSPPASLICGHGHLMSVASGNSDLFLLMTAWVAGPWAVVLSGVSPGSLRWLHCAGSQAGAGTHRSRVWCFSSGGWSGLLPGQGGGTSSKGPRSEAAGCLGGSSQSGHSLSGCVPLG